MRTKQFLFARGFVHVALAGMIFLAAERFAPAQEDDAPAKPVANDATSLLNQAYRKTKGAQTQQQFSEIVELCKRALVAKPDKNELMYIQRLLSWSCNRRGETYVGQAADDEEKGDFQRADQLEALALADFETAVKYDANRWKAIHNRAVSYAHIEKYDSAITDLTRVIQLKPDYANALFNRAELYSELGQYQKAVEDYGQVLKLDDKDLSAYLGRGSAYARREKFNEALSDFNRTLELDKKSPLAYVHRAEVYMHLGRWQQASTDYRQAIQLNDRSGRAYRGASWLMATCPDKRFRHVDLASRAAQKAIELDGKDDYRNLEAIAAAEANAGRFDVAALNQGKALKLAPPAQHESINRRLLLYKSKKPYRQPKSSPEKSP